jgi:hypothetical protein
VVRRVPPWLLSVSAYGQRDMNSLQTCLSQDGEDDVQRGARYAWALLCLSILALLRVVWLLLAGQPGKIELPVWLILLALPATVWFIRWSRRHDTKMLANLDRDD